MRGVVPVRATRIIARRSARYAPSAFRTARARRHGPRARSFRAARSLGLQHTLVDFCLGGDPFQILAQAHPAGLVLLPSSLSCVGSAETSATSSVFPFGCSKAGKTATRAMFPICLDGADCVNADARHSRIAVAVMAEHGFHGSRSCCSGCSSSCWCSRLLGPPLPGLTAHWAYYPSADSKSGWFLTGRMVKRAGAKGRTAASCRARSRS